MGLQGARHQDWRHHRFVKVSSEQTASSLEVVEYDVSAAAAALNGFICCTEEPQK
jgi:hypothetical protein